MFNPLLITQKAFQPSSRASFLIPSLFSAFFNGFDLSLSLPAPFNQRLVADDLN